jgi:hypothetical protein
MIQAHELATTVSIGGSRIVIALYGAIFLANALGLG